MAIDRQYIREEIQDLLNSTPTKSNQDFTAARINKAIDQAIKREIRKAVARGRASWFKAFKQYTWTSGALTYSLPEEMRGVHILAIWDVTNADPGSRIDNGFWKDRNTLQWGTVGPGADVTMRFEYMHTGNDLNNDQDTPDFFPEAHRELLWWSAAADLRMRADEEVPQVWQYTLEELRYDFWKHISYGRPQYGNESSVASLADVSISGAQATQDGSSIGN